MIPVTPVILIYAFRYALGRQTHSVADVTQTIIVNKEKLPQKYKSMIAHEIQTAIQQNRAGNDGDVSRWKTVVEVLTNGR